MSEIESFGRRRLLQAAVAGGVAATGVTAGPAAAARPPVPGVTRRAGVTMRWLGVAGFEIAFDGHVLYFDPYLSRFDYKRNGGALAADPTVAERLLATGRLGGPPEVVMVSHGHWDHLTDVPDLLNRPAWRDATITAIGTDTQRNLLTAMGTAPARLSGFVTASGGEDLTFRNGAYRIQVLRGLHSQSAGFGYFAPGVRVAPPARPTVIDDLVEGGTLAYQVTVPGRLTMLLLGGTNFVERELVGLRPDVVTVCLTDHSAVHRYLERLLTVLGGPRYVIPVHHDDMVTGFDQPGLPGTIDRSRVDRLREVIAKLRLRTRVVEPAHLEPISF